jgi:hypothetical protein
VGVRQDRKRAALPGGSWGLELGAGGSGTRTFWVRKVWAVDVGLHMWVHASPAFHTGQGRQGPSCCVAVEVPCSPTAARAFCVLLGCPWLHASWHLSLR